MDTLSDGVLARAKFYPGRVVVIIELELSSYNCVVVQVPTELTITTVEGSKALLRGTTPS